MRFKCTVRFGALSMSCWSFIRSYRVSSAVPKITEFTNKLRAIFGDECCVSFEVRSFRNATAIYTVEKCIERLLYVLSRNVFESSRNGDSNVRDITVTLFSRDYFTRLGRKNNCTVSGATIVTRFRAEKTIFRPRSHGETKTRANFAKFSALYRRRD